MQVANWKRFYNIIDGEKATFIFVEKYETPIEKIDNRKGNSGKSEGSRGNNNTYAKYIDVILYNYFYKLDRYIDYTTTNKLAKECCLININYSTAFSNKNKYFKYSSIQTQDSNMTAMYDFFGIVKGSIKGLIRSSLDRLQKDKLIIYIESHMLVYNNKSRPATDSETLIINSIEDQVLQDMKIENKNKLQYNDRLRNEYYENVEKLVIQELDNVESLYIGYKVTIFKENFKSIDKDVLYEKSVLNEIFIYNVLEKLRKIKNKIEAEYAPWLTNYIGRPKSIDFLNKYISDRLNINYIYYVEFVVKSLLNKDFQNITEIIHNIKIAKSNQNDEPINWENMSKEEIVDTYNRAEDEDTKWVIEAFHMKDIDIPY